MSQQLKALISSILSMLPCRPRPGSIDNIECMCIIMLSITVSTMGISIESHNDMYGFAIMCIDQYLLRSL